MTPDVKWSVCAAKLPRMLAPAPAERVSSLAFSGRLIAQLPAGQRQEHALEAGAVDRQPLECAAEALEKSLGRSICAGLDDDGAVGACGRRRIGCADCIGGRGILRHRANEFAAMCSLERRRRIDRKDAAAVDDAQPVAALDLFDI